MPEDDSRSRSSWGLRREYHPISNYTINLCKEHNYPMHFITNRKERPLSFNIQSNLAIKNTEVKTVKVRTTGMKKNHQLLSWRVLVTDRNWDQKWFSRGRHYSSAETSMELWSLASWMDIKRMKSLACATWWLVKTKKRTCWWCLWSSRDRKGEAEITKQAA